MALASQTARPPSGRTSEQFNRSSVGGGGKNPRLIVGFVVVALAIVALVWGFNKMSGGGAGGGGAGNTPPVADPNAGRPPSPDGPKHAIPVESPKPEEPNGLAGTPKPDAENTGMSASNPADVNAAASASGADGTLRTTPGATDGAAPVTPAPVPEVNPADVTDLPTQVNDWLQSAQKAQSEGRLVEARTLLNNALRDERIGETDREAFRAILAELNSVLVFSPAVSDSDPLVGTYAVESGDNLTKIANKAGAVTSWRFIARVNRMADPNRLKLGQRLKVVKGPFHVIVDKSAYRMDIYAGSPPPPGSPGAAGPESDWIYIRSFPVGLGENNMTPTATFHVKPNSKLINPHWANPRTGERFDADDPKNPIGERWVGLEGSDVTSKQYAGFGIHGTIDPTSIGKQMSMGCIRMNAGDVEVVWEMLQDQISTVKIVP